MYKFTNGIIVYDSKTKDKFLKNGYKLVKKEEVDGNKQSNNRIIKEKSKTSNKLSK